MKKILFLLLLFPLFTRAQKSHTVAAKETLYSISRMYKVTPRELADFNNISVNAGLNIGQVIKIPGKAASTTAVKKDLPVKEPVKPEVKKEVKPEAHNNKVPLFHTVQKKETLYQISKKYNKVTVADLKKWNKLSSDAVNEGMTLIVGYTSEDIPAPKVEEVKVVEKTVPEEVIIEEKKEETKPAPVKSTEMPKPAVVKDVKIETVKPASDNKNTGGGYFSTQYNAAKSSKEESGMAGMFKTTSGWDDKKYYCLHNTAASGTIIKITNKANQKTIYAKVLDIIPDLKLNEGILIRISNAAVEELGAGAENFEVILNF